MIKTWHKIFILNLTFISGHMAFTRSLLVMQNTRARHAAQLICFLRVLESVTGLRLIMPFRAWAAPEPLTHFPGMRESTRAAESSHTGDAVARRPLIIVINRGEMCLVFPAEGTRRRGGQEKEKGKGQMWGENIKAWMKRRRCEKVRGEAR